MYLTPGILISEKCLGTKILNNNLQRLFFYVISSYIFSSLLWMTLKTYSLNNYISSIYIILTIIFFFINNKIMKFFKKERLITNRMVLFITLISFISFLIYHNGNFLRGWDQANHFVNYINVLQREQPQINSLIEPYYPKGYVTAITTYTSILRIDVEISFKVFNAILVSLFPMAIYTFTQYFYGEKAAFYSSISYITLGYLLLKRGNFPFMISLFCIGLLYILNNFLFNKRKLDINVSIYYFFIMTYSYLSHPSLLFFYIFSYSIYILYKFITNFTSESLKNLLFNISVFISSLGFSYIIDPNLFLGQINFLQNYNTSYDVKIHNLLPVRSTVNELLIVYIGSILIFPFLIGLFKSLKNFNESEFIFPILLTSLLYSMIPIFPPYNAREIYYLFYPLHSITGLGMCFIENTFKISNIISIRIKNFKIKININ